MTSLSPQPVHPLVLAIGMLVVIVLIVGATLFYGLDHLAAYLERRDKRKRAQRS